MEQTSPSAILRSWLAGSSFQSWDHGESAGIQCVYTSGLGVQLPQAEPKAQSRP